MPINILFWFVTAVFFMLFELGHPGLFYFLSFSCGAGAACLASLAGLALFDQIVLFFLVSACATAALRKWVRRHGTRGHYQSNVYAMRGKRGVVVTPTVIGHSMGYMHVEGQVWAFKSIDEEVIPAGIPVEVVDVHGAHLVVKRISH